MMTERTAYIMVGLPGTGKSTWISRNLGAGARIANTRDGAVVLSTDRLVEHYARGLGKTYDDVFGSYIESAINMFNHQLEQMINHPVQTLVLDQTNLTPKKRRGLVARLKRSYDKVVAIYVQAPADEVLQRRLDAREGKTIPAHVLENMRRSFSKPTLDEGFDDVYTVG